MQAAVPYDQRARAWKAAHDEVAAERKLAATEARRRRELDRPARERERKLLPTAAPVLASLTQRSSAPAELGRCPSCDRVYYTRANYGTRLI